MDLRRTLAGLIEMMFKGDFYGLFGTCLRKRSRIDVSKPSHFNVINPDRTFVLWPTFDK